MTAKISIWPRSQALAGAMLQVNSKAAAVLLIKALLMASSPNNFG
jgi:hypothetical protein